VTCLAFSPNGKLVLTGAYNGTVGLWAADSGKLLMMLKKHAGHVKCVAFSPDGQLALSADSNGWVFLWRIDKPITDEPLGMYVTTYEVGAIHWQTRKQIILADTGGQKGRPHFYRLSLEGRNRVIGKKLAIRDNRKS
jgi:WD40 repeat protein